jgi:fructose-bisphosphate aldolase / 6-deoxy-5-ketofructose 1-phosphate synthase
MIGKNGRVFVFAADQKIEHLDDDFVGKGIAPEAGDPEHLFRIADAGGVDLFATQLGLITRHGEKWRGVPYLAKLNGRTNLMDPTVDDPRAGLLWTVQDVVEVAKNLGVKIPAVGYTVFLGSGHEVAMLQEAAQVVMEAHREGLQAFLWIYAKGVSVKNSRDAAVVAGAAGVAHALGADFVKVYAPAAVSAEESGKSLGRAIRAAGNTGVICAGGERTEIKELIETVWYQVNAGARGVAIGRNIFQRSLGDATKICHAIKAVVHSNASIDKAIALCR